MRSCGVINPLPRKRQTNSLASCLPLQGRHIWAGIRTANNCESTCEQRSPPMTENGFYK